MQHKALTCILLCKCAAKGWGGSILPCLYILILHSQKFLAVFKVCLKDLIDWVTGNMVMLQFTASRRTAAAGNLRTFKGLCPQFRREWAHFIWSSSPVHSVVEWNCCQVEGKRHSMIHDGAILSRNARLCELLTVAMHIPKFLQLPGDLSGFWASCRLM
jgi:hypothetical protein